jgi:hypothetical protein
VDPSDGFIASIVDRKTGRELVNGEAPFGFNEVIYDRYASAAGFNHLSCKLQADDLSLHGSRSTAKRMTLIQRIADPVGERLRFRLDAEGADWLETTVTLPRAVKRIEFTNRLHKTPTAEKESIYLAFPFAISDPDPEYEISGGVTSHGAPHVPGSA